MLMADGWKNGSAGITVGVSSGGRVSTIPQRRETGQKIITARPTMFRRGMKPQLRPSRLKLVLSPSAK